MSRFSVIVAAAGSGTRFASGSQKKTYAMLAGDPVWKHSVRRFVNRDDVAEILIVVSPEDEAWFAETNREFLQACSASVVAGGSERCESVNNALQKVANGVEFVAVHDAARPCVSPEMIERVFAAAKVHGNAVPAIPVSSTLKRSADGVKVLGTVDRSELFESQTPQVFRVNELREANEFLATVTPTDEAQLMERMGYTVFLAEGCALNRKITSQPDMDFAEAALAIIARVDRGPIHFDGPLDNTKLR